jgi:hypothetical protein
MANCREGWGGNAIYYVVMKHSYAHIFKPLHSWLTYTFLFKISDKCFVYWKCLYKICCQIQSIWDFNAVKFHFTLCYKLKQLTVSFLLQRPWCSATTVHIKFVICGRSSRSEAGCSKFILSFIWFTSSFLAYSVGTVSITSKENSWITGLILITILQSAWSCWRKSQRTPGHIVLGSWLEPETSQILNKRAHLCLTHWHGPK